MNLLDVIKKRTEDIENILITKNDELEKPSINKYQTKAENPTDAIMGLAPDGSVVHHPISDFPHALVAGTTGSGKSVFLNSVLLSMIAHASPEELKLAIVDPKKVEFTRYKGLPYMIADPITDMDDASIFFDYLTILMEERYSDMAELGVQNITQYNEIAEEHGKERFPYVVLVVDEYSQLVGRHKEVEQFIVELGQMARAAGIHVIIATQTPRATIINGTIKANFPTRIALMVSSDIESRIILDELGAEKLSPRGDMLIQVNGGKMQRAQAPFISNGEIERIFEELRSTMAPPTYVDFKAIVAEKRGEDEGVESSQTPSNSFGGVGGNQINLSQPLRGKKASQDQPSIEKSSPFARKLSERENDEMQENGETKPKLARLKAEKLERIDKVLAEAKEATASKKGISSTKDKPIQVVIKPKELSKTLTAKETDTAKETPKSTQSSSPILRKMMQAKKDSK